MCTIRTILRARVRIAITRSHVLWIRLCTVSALLLLLIPSPLVFLVRLLHQVTRLGDEARKAPHDINKTGMSQGSETFVSMARSVYKQVHGRGLDCSIRPQGPLTFSGSAAASTLKRPMSI